MRIICEFWKIELVKREKSKQRIVESKKLFGNLINNVVSPPTIWGHYVFSIIFKILWQWKVEGCLFADFVGYYLEGLLISRAKFSEKVNNE